MTCRKINNKLNGDCAGRTQKGGMKWYHRVKSVPMVYSITKKWLDTMIRKTRISVDHNNGPNCSYGLLYHKEMACYNNTENTY